MRQSPNNICIPQIPVLMYHEVIEISECGNRYRKTNPAYCITIKQFFEQMQYLSVHGYKTLLFHDILDCRHDNCEKSLVITFDDGWENNYTAAFPILQSYGLKATIFVVTSFVGQKGYMNWEQLKELVANGISIQSHTVSHLPLSELEDERLLSELEVSKKTLEDHLGKAVDFLSLPHGVYNRKVIEMAMNAGYKAICTSEPGYAHEYKSYPVFKRINISDKYHIKDYIEIINKNENFIMPAIVSGKFKTMIRKIIGYKNYRKIYQLRFMIQNKNSINAKL